MLVISLYKPIRFACGCIAVRELSDGTAGVLTAFCPTHAALHEASDGEAPEGCSCPSCSLHRHEWSDESGEPDVWAFLARLDLRRRKTAPA